MQTNTQEVQVLITTQSPEDKKTLQDMSKSKQIKILEENANSLGNQRTQVMDDDRVLII